METMNTKKAVDLIAARIDELLADKEIQSHLIEKKTREKLTNEEVRDYITTVAIATLYGVAKQQ